MPRNGSAHELRTEPPGSARPNPEPVKAEARRLDAPSFYAASAQVLVSGNDATLLFSRPHPAILPDGSLAPVPMRETVALVQMSIAGMKDLALILTDMVRRVEQQTGVIQSELSGPSGFALAGANKRASNGH
jgi:hypothetical protein